MRKTAFLRKRGASAARAAFLALFTALLFAAGCGAAEGNGVVKKTEAPGVTDAPKDALLSVTSGGTTIVPYENWVWSSSYINGAFLAADGFSFTHFMPDIAGDIPSITLGEDFSIRRAEGVKLSGISIYDESCERLYHNTNTARFHALANGTYYIAIGVSKRGDYIAALREYESAGHECVFRLEIENAEAQTPESTTAQQEQAPVEWTFYPVLSSRYPAFAFRFNMEYDFISAGCDFGSLIGFDDHDGADYPQGTALTFPGGSALYWSPLGGGAGEPALFATIEFVLFDEDNGALHSGVLSVTGTADTGDAAAGAVYTAVLTEHDGLVMEPAEGDGARIKAAGD